MPEDTSPIQNGTQSPPGDDILEIIRNVENQLSQLREASNDHERMLQSMLHQQAELEQQDHALVERATRLSEREQRLESAEAGEADRAAALDRRAAELASTKEELAEQARRLSERESSVALIERESIEQQQAFESQFTEIIEQAQHFKAETADFARLRAELDTEIKRLGARAKKLETDLADVTQERGVLEADNARLRGDLEAAEALAQGAESTEDAVRKLRASLEKREQHIAELAQRLDSAQTEAQRLRNAFTDASARDHELAAAHTELQSLRAQVAESLRIKEELECLRAEHAAAGVQNDGAVRADPTEELAKIRESLTGAAKQAETVASVAEHLQRLHELFETRDGSDADAEELAAEIQRQRARADASRADAEELRQRLETASARLSELEAAAASGAAAGTGADARELLAKRDKVIEQLTAQLKDAQTARASAASRRSDPEAAERESKRRDRLRSMRNSLRDKAARLAQAKDIIEQRQAECEQILRLRSDLAAQREALQREKAVVAKGSTKSGAGIAALCAAIGMLLLAPLSWKAAGLVAPSDHLSSARIAMQARNGSPLPPDKLDRFHTLIADLAEDPQLIDQAATRMKRRGIEAYADPAALAAALREHLDVSFPEAGAAEIAYTDRGDLLTLRTLETYLAAIVTAANDRTAARLENTVVVVAKAPDTPAPVDLGTRPFVAGGIWAGSSLLSLGFIAFVAVAMTKARERIRGEEALLAAARDGSGIGWNEPTRD